MTCAGTCSPRGRGPASPTRRRPGTRTRPPARGTVEDRPAAGANRCDGTDPALPGAESRVGRRDPPRVVERGEERVYRPPGYVVVDQRLRQPLGERGRCVQCGQSSGQREGHRPVGTEPDPRRQPAQLVAGTLDDRTTTR